MSLVRRMAFMSLGEIACRTRQRAERWWDAMTPAFGPAGEPRRRRERRLGPSQSEPRARFFDAAPHRFFAGATDLSWLPAESTGGDWRAGVVRRAQAIAGGRFDLLGYQDLDFGSPIEWHVDPVSGRRAPLVHWGRINALDANTVGDSKVIWELNRHQWMVTLGQAYRLTGNRRYADIVLDRVEEWILANPYPYGINWASSLEASLRLIAWCWTLFLIGDAPSLTDERFARWQTLMRAHARHVERYLSQYYSPNTHLTGEALGLVYAGTVFAGCADAARWRDIGRRVLVDEIERQVHADGVYFEQATCYQRYTAEIYLHLLVLAARNHLHLPPEVPAAARRLVRGLVAVMRPDHTVPSIGDDDGGCLLPLVRRESSDCRGTFALAAVVFDDAEFAWAAGAWSPEASWLLGPGAEAHFQRIAQRPPAEPASTILPRGGYAVMRSGWTDDAHQLILDVGPLGCAVSGAHGHADLLSLQCVAFGEPFIVDPGTYCYTADRAWRDYFRSTAAHSTVLIDRRSQADPLGPFSWRVRPSARLVAWESTPGHDFVDAAHGAYERKSDPVTHRRRVLFLKPDAWIVIDDLAGEGEHVCELRFQFSPRPVALADEGWVRAEGRHGRGLWLKSISSTPLSMQIREGSHDPIDGWISTGYGLRQPAPISIASAVWTGAIRLVTAIMPADPLPVSSPELEVVRSQARQVIGMRLPGDSRMVHFDDASVTIEHLVDRQRSA